MISTARDIYERKVSSVISRQKLDIVHSGPYECMDQWDVQNYDRIYVRVISHSSDRCTYRDL